MVVQNQRKAKDNAEIMCRKSKKESSRLYLISFSLLLFKKNQAKDYVSWRTWSEIRWFRTLLLRNQMKKMGRAAFFFENRRQGMTGWEAWVSKVLRRQRRIWFYFLCWRWWWIVECVKLVSIILFFIIIFFIFFKEKEKKKN